MDFDKIRCSKCIYYNHLYIHPWSEVPEDLKMSRKGFACLLTIDPQFMKDDPEEDWWVDVMVGKDDSCGCECFTEKDKYNLIFKLEKKNE